MVSAEDPIAAPTDVNVMDVTVQPPPPPILSTRTLTTADTVELGPEITGANTGTGGGGEATAGGGEEGEGEEGEGEGEEGEGEGEGDAFATKSYRLINFHDVYIVGDTVESSIKTG